MEYHVYKDWDDMHEGTFQNHFSSIQQAADVALPGDVVIVHQGTYRECIVPKRGGTDNHNRIEYRAAAGEKVIVKGSEIVNDWIRDRDGVWKTEIDNRLFGDYNPYNTLIKGDWIRFRGSEKIHTGDVFLDGQSIFEARTKEELYNPQVREYGYQFPWKENHEPILRSDLSKYVWYAEVGDNTTVIYANFQKLDPEDICVEVSVRKSCFYPKKNFVNYITIQGFEFAQAATTWAPPTVEQIGMIGTKWSKGWKILNNHIHDSKCVGISIGKTHFAEDDRFSVNKDITGFQYQTETIFSAYKMGWDKDTIGSHVIQNNKIHDCGQTGIAGHLGCVFSRIEHNEIYNIACKHEFFGEEIAGLKLHDPIDVLIEDNCFHHCTLGTWLDWDIQGTRISHNTYYENQRDLMIEVGHGPYIVDQNIFGSKYNLFNLSEGGAFIQNIFCGGIRHRLMQDRYTPYFVPHSTKVAGSMPIYGGDDRYFQNIFVGGHDNDVEQYYSGLQFFDEYPGTYREFRDDMKTPQPRDSHLQYKTKQAVYIGENTYINNAGISKHDENAAVGKGEISVYSDNGKVYFKWRIDTIQIKDNRSMISSDKLQCTRTSHAAYENFDETPIEFDHDFFGIKLGKDYIGGMFECDLSKENTFCIWKESE